MSPEPGAAPSPGGVRRRVLVVAHDIHWDGGMERAFAELLERHADEMEFTVLSSTLAPELRGRVRWHRVPVPARPFPLKFVAFFILAPLLRRGLAADLVHTCGAIVPFRADIASVHFCHRGFVAATGHIAPPGAPPARRINTAITRSLALLAERFAYRPSRVRRLACVSRGLEAEVVAAFPAAVTAVTPNGVETPTDPARLARRRREARGSAGVGDDDVVVLFVGGDWERKGLALAIESLASSTHRQSLVLWVVGPGNSHRHARIAEQLGVGDRVVFLGPRSDTDRFYAAADIFVIPSMYETFSLVAMEAAAAGLPVIGTRVHGVTNLLAEGGGGILVERTTADLSAALDRLAGSRELRATLGAAGRAFVSTMSWSASTGSVLALYEELAREAP